jgi:hypothetical protein
MGVNKKYWLILKNPPKSPRAGCSRSSIEAEA